MPRMITPYAVQLAPWSLEVTDRPRWKRMRAGGLGGSDIGAAAGMSERRTRMEVYLSKVSPDLYEDPAQGSRLEELFWFGHEMEAVAAKRFRMLHPGTRTRRCGMIASRTDPWMRVNPDFLVSGCELGPCVVEVKNRTAWSAQDWDREGDAEKIPDAEAVQALWPLIVLGGPLAGYTHSHLAVVIGGNELRQYTIPWDPALASLLIEEGRWFWHDHVLPRVPPPADASERTSKILARLWQADPGAIMTAGPEETALVTALRAAEDAQDKAKGEVTRLRNELMAAMGEAEILIGGDGRPLVTWKQNSTFRDSDFQAEHPDEFARYKKTRECTDTTRLAEENPGLYGEYRARALRVCQPRER